MNFVFCLTCDLAKLNAAEAVELVSTTQILPHLSLPVDRPWQDIEARRVKRQEIAAKSARWEVYELNRELKNLREICVNQPCTVVLSGAIGATDAPAIYE